MLWELPEAYCLFDPLQNSVKSDRACKLFSSLPCIDFLSLGKIRKRHEVVRYSSLLFHTFCQLQAKNIKENAGSSI